MTWLKNVFSRRQSLRNQITSSIKAPGHKRLFIFFNGSYQTPRYDFVSDHSPLLLAALLFCLLIQAVFYSHFTVFLNGITAPNALARTSVQCLAVGARVFLEALSNADYSGEHKTMFSITTSRCYVGIL